MSAASDDGKVRWRAAGLILGDESGLLARDRDDATLQVAIEGAFEGFRSNATGRPAGSVRSCVRGPTEALERLSSAERFDDDESTEAVDAPESETIPFDASEVWLKATEALEDTFEAAADAEDANYAAGASRAAASDAKGAARAIYSAAQADGDWEAFATEFEVRLAGALSSARAAEDFSMYVVRDCSRGRGRL